MKPPRIARSTRRTLLTFGVALAVSVGPRATLAQTPNRPAAGSVAAPGAVSVDSGGTTTWTRLGRSALFVGGLALLDQPVRDGAADIQRGFGDDLASFGRDYGDWRKTSLLFGGGVMLAGAAIDGGRGARRGVAVVTGVAVASLTNEGLNRAVGRRRPDEDRGAWSFAPFGDHASFASGHAAYTFAFAAAIDAIAEDWWVSAPFYAAAGVSALSRVYHDRHWLSDVGAGAVIGIWLGGAATRQALDVLGVGDGAGAGGIGPIEPVVGAGLVAGRIRF